MALKQLAKMVFDEALWDLIKTVFRSLKSEGGKAVAATLTQQMPKFMGIGFVDEGIWQKVLSMAACIDTKSVDRINALMETLLDYEAFCLKMAIASIEAPPLKVGEGVSIEELAKHDPRVWAVLNISNQLGCGGMSPTMMRQALLRDGTIRFRHPVADAWLKASKHIEKFLAETGFSTLAEKFEAEQNEPVEVGLIEYGAQWFVRLFIVGPKRPLKLKWSNGSKEGAKKCSQ